MEKRIEDLEEKNIAFKSYEEACSEIENIIRWDVLGPLWQTVRHLEQIKSVEVHKELEACCKDFDTFGQYENDMESVRCTLEGIYHKLKAFADAV